MEHALSTSYWSMLFQRRTGACPSLSAYIIPADVQCPPPTIGEHTTVQHEDFSYGSVVIVLCQNGYGFEDGSRLRSVTCMANGKWSNDIQLCIGTIYCRKYIILSIPNIK